MTKIQTTIAAGTAADLIWVGQGDLPDLAEKGALMDLTDRLAADDHPAADLGDYFDSPLVRYTFDGRIYGLPWIAMPVMLYINLDHAEAAGFYSYQINDWDWDAFQEACIKMTVDANGMHPDEAGFDASDVKQYGFSVVPGWPPVQMWIWQAGGEVLSEDLSSSPIGLILSP